MSFKIGDMSAAIDLLMGDYQLQRKTETYLNGELTETFTDPENVHCAVLPLGSKELRTLPEGEYTTEDKSVITDGSIVLNINDRILAFGNLYEIRRFTDVSDLLNLKVFVAKKI
jgi:hypothetical protein